MRGRRRTLGGTSGAVRIDRDDDGVAEVEAEALDDALFGLGYCHARDRGLQMRMVRILARGQGSRWLESSDEMLEIDRFFRRLNFGGDADDQEAALTPRARTAVDAYCRGVDEAFRDFGIPWELRILGDKAGGDPWTFADVYLTAKVIGYVALAVCQAEIERWIIECVQHGIGRDHLEEMFPGRLEGLDEDLMRRVRLQERIIPKDLWQLKAIPLGIASNNWVVAGSKTASGRPIACNDPHLQINRLPAFWYEAVLRWRSEGDSHYAMGATLPGTPGIIVGRNADVAWSVTYAFMDCVDSWVEDCRDGRYRRGDEWFPFRVRRETILRKHKGPVVIDFYENGHGTLEGDPHEPGLYLASRWSCGEETGAASLDGLLEMMQARDVRQGTECLGRLSNSSWNWLLADRGGTIGYQMSGKMPLRRPGTSGLVALPGWDPENDWRGFAPLEDLPRTLDPPEGFLATANDDLNHLGTLAPINLCVAPYRAERIRHVLSRAETVSVEDMEALQYDVYSTQAERFLKILKPLLAEAQSNANARLLLGWDCRYHLDSRAATLFERFYRQLIEEVFGGGAEGDHEPRKLGVPVVDHLLDETTLLAEYYGVFDNILLSERSLWFGRRSREEIYRAVLARVLPTEAKPLGDSRKIVLRHLLLGSKLPKFLGFDRGPVPLRGGRATVHQGQVLRNRGREMACGPSYRFVTDLGTDELRANLPGGPSDRPFSRWYARGLDDWWKGRYRTLRGRGLADRVPES